MYKNYSGLQVTFPTRLESLEHLHTQILNEYDGTNLRFLARKYGYSERWLREIIKENKKEN